MKLLLVLHMTLSLHFLLLLMPTAMHYILDTENLPFVSRVPNLNLLVSC